MAERISGESIGCTLGFDVAPSSSGPGRYVSSIVNSLDSTRFKSVITCGKQILLSADGTRDGSESGATSRLPRECTNRVQTSTVLAAKLLLGALATSRARARVLNRERIDICHAQNTGCEESPIAARMAGIPVVLGTFHTDPTYDLDGERNGPAFRTIEWISNRCLHHAIAVSEETKRSWVRRTRIADQKVTVIHNGVCCETHKRRVSREGAKRQLGLPPHALVVGAVGRLDRAKGHADLIDAFALLAPKHPRALLVIAGEGPLRKQLESQARRLGVESRVRMLGYVGDVAGVYDALDVYAMPSLCEALPFALLEAMAHGLPAVASRAGGMPEVVVDGETGRLVDVNDSQSLADALSGMLSSEEIRRQYGLAGRLRVVRSFTESQMACRTINLYEHLIDQRLR